MISAALPGAADKENEVITRTQGAAWKARANEVGRNFYPRRVTEIC